MPQAMFSFFFRTMCLSVRWSLQAKTLAQTEGGVEQLEANCYAMFDSGIWLRDRTGLQQLYACKCLGQD